MGDWFQKIAALSLIEWLLLVSASVVYVVLYARFWLWMNPWARSDYQPPAVPWWKSIPRHR